MVELRSELEGPNSTPLESLLAEWAATCWLTVNHHETSFARSSQIIHREAEYQQFKIYGADWRFFSAVKTWQRSANWGLPNIRINVAKNQVDVG